MDAETKQELLSISLLMRKNAEKNGEKEEKVGIDKEGKKNRIESFSDGSAIEYDENGMPIQWWDPKVLPQSAQDETPQQDGSDLQRSELPILSTIEGIERKDVGNDGTGKAKVMVVNALRWVGAAVLPPVGLFVGGVIVRMSASSAYRYLSIDPQNPGIVNLPVVIGEALIAGCLLPLTSYLLAPRHKFFTCAIVTAVYTTFFFVCFVVFFFRCHPDWLETLKQVAILGGMVGGAVYAREIAE